MKVREVEYAICRNGEYVVETYDKKLQEGGFTFTRYIEDATTFPSAENAEKFVEDEMKLNIQNVSIHRAIYYEPTIQPLVKCNGIFANINEVGYCSHEDCKDPHLLHDLHYFQIDDESEPQLYCLEHYNELNEKWHNSFHGNQDSDVVDEVDEVAEHYAKLHKYYDEKGVK